MTDDGGMVAPRETGRPTGDPSAQEGAAASARRLRPGPGGNPALDRLAELAARLLRAPSSQVSLLPGAATVVGGAGLPPGTVGSDSPVADSICTLTARSGAPVVVEDAAADERVRDLPPVASGAVGSYLGVPLTADDGHVVGALCVLDGSPRRWPEADVALLQQVATSVVAELERSALSAEHGTGQLVWGLAVEAAGIGTFDWDLTTGALTWDERLLELFGHDAATFDRTIEAFNARVHPDDLPWVTAALEGAVEACGEYDAEYRVVLPGGGLRWVAARGRALGDASGRAVRLLGAAYDTTAVREGDARLSRVLESMSAAFLSLDHEWRITYANAEAERVLGRARQDLLGEVLWEAFPAAVGTVFDTQYREAVRTGQPVAFEAHYPAPLDAWYEVRAWPGPEGLSLYFLDVTARRTAQAEAARAAQRSALLSDVSAELTDTLDPEVAAARLARLVVPALADGCIVSRLDGEHGDWRRGLHDSGSWHVEPGLRPLLERYCALRAGALTDASHVARVVRTGRRVVVPRGAGDRLDDLLAPGGARSLRAALGVEAAAVLPLRGRGRTVGVLTVFNGEQRGPLSPEDLTTLDDVAARAGLALDNVRLYAQQRDLAEGLQRSLLTGPAEPDHAQVVVRYTPAAEAAQVGGDWYDAFPQRDGRTVLVIGDVVGHDTAAAAAMSQLRGLLRGIAAHTGDGPADVLRGVDQVVETLQVETTASAVVARLEQSEQERAAGTTRLRWSNAGHPPPMLVHPDGEVEVLTGAGSNLLLGINPRSHRAESEVHLGRGATVLFYTDGLVERRGQPLQEGLGLLQETIAALAAQDLPLDDLCHELLARLVPERPEDDVALLAVRVHRQDAPCRQPFA